MAKKKAKKVRIKLVRSMNGRKPVQRATARALGLGKIGSAVEKEISPAITGMINRVNHLVEVEEIS